MARRSTGSQRKSSGSGGRSGVQNYFRKAVERGAAKGQMQAYGKEIHAITAIGAGAESTALYNVPRSQRKLIGQHWNLVNNALNAETPQERKEAQRALDKFARQHKTTGGVNSQEFATDINDIIRGQMADPEAYAKGPYEKDQL